MDYPDFWRVAQKMTQKLVDLYNEFALPRPAGARADLRCWCALAAEKVSTARRRPAVLILPGGAYAWTSPREAEPVALRFAARGYAAFVLDYSCAPLCFPVSLREAAMAMLYIRRHAAEYQIDPAMVAALGFSAGGHLCGTLGMLYDAPELADLAPGADIRPDALVLCYPVAAARGRTHDESFVNLTGGDAALRARLSLDRLVRPDMPPVFLWHTRDDDAVPCRGTLLLAAALEEAGVDFALHIYRHGQHGLATADALVYPAHDVPAVSPEVPAWPEAAQSFLAECGFGITDKEAEA